MKTVLAKSKAVTAPARISKFLTLSFLSIAVTACGPAVTLTIAPEGLETDDIVTTGEEVDFATLELTSIAILTSQCLKCHGRFGEDGVSNINDPKALLAQQLIVPGSPSLSRLIRVVESGAMPKKAPRMDPADIEILKSWIKGY